MPKQRFVDLSTILFVILRYKMDLLQVIQSARACEKKRRSGNTEGSLEEGKRVHGILVCLSVSRLVSLFFFVVNCRNLEQFFYITWSKSSCQAEMFVAKSVSSLACLYNLVIIGERGKRCERESIVRMLVILPLSFPFRMDCSAQLYDEEDYRQWRDFH